MPVSDNPTLDEVLHNDLLVASFQKHNAEKIFDPKPVPFLLAVERFQKAALDPKVSAERLSEMAAQITADYVKPDNYVMPKNVSAAEGNADDFINISNTQSKETNANVAKLGQIARGEIPMPSREEMAATFDVANAEMRKLVSDAGNNLDSWKKTPAFTEAMGSIKNSEDKITQLEKQAEKLQNSRWERFKAFFKGGADKEMGKLVAKIDEAKMELLMKTDMERFKTVQREKEKMAEKLGQKQAKLTPNEVEFQQVKDASIQLALDGAGLRGGSLGKEQRAELQQQADKAPRMVASKEAGERAGQQKEELHKSVKVGDVLKGQLGNRASQGQSSPRVR